MHLVFQSQSFSNFVYHTAELIGNKGKLIIDADPEGPSSSWQERDTI